MSDTTTTTETPTFKMSIAETVTMLQGYLKQADNTLGQLQTSIDSANNQITEWKRIQLMIVGQKQLINDILNKAVDGYQTNQGQAPTQTN